MKAPLTAIDNEVLLKRAAYAGLNILSVHNGLDHFETAKFVHIKRH
jgi:hypothetical protein